jgi:hypothetical protein
MAKAPKSSVVEDNNDGLSSIVEYSVDLNDQDQPEPLPAREYAATIQRASKRVSGSGNTYAEVMFFIDADQYPADYVEGNPDGTVIAYRRVSLEDNPQARWGARKFIEAIGATLSRQVDVSEWVGLEALVEVAHQTYEGTERAEIRRVREV